MMMSIIQPFFHRQASRPSRPVVLVVSLGFKLACQCQFRISRKGWVSDKLDFAQLLLSLYQMPQLDSIGTDSRYHAVGERQADSNGTDGRYRALNNRQPHKSGSDDRFHTANKRQLDRSTGGRRQTAKETTERAVESTGHKKEEAEDGTWPASLRRYLQRAFDECGKGQGSRQHEELEKALHRAVTDAMADNSLLTKDWDNEPLPRYI